MDSMTRLFSIARERILILDGAMGTIIQSRALSEDDFRGDKFCNHDADLTGNYDILSLTKPELIISIHNSYLKSGADIIRTNTFSSSSLEQSHYNTSEYVYEINFTAAKLAREETDKFIAINSLKPRFVAGVVGPGRNVCSTDLANKAGFEVKSFDELKESYKPQITGLIDGEVDFLLFETIYDANNAKAAISVLDDLKTRGFPVWLSATKLNYNSEKDLQKLIETIIKISNEYNIFSLGLNCSIERGLSQKYIELIANSSNSLVSYHPGAGLPDKSGKYSITPRQFEAEIKDLAAKGLVNIVGGCCGTTPEYISIISESVKDIKPRRFQT